MAEGKSRQLWDHTAFLSALIANAQCREKGQAAYMPARFNPFDAPKADQTPDVEVEGEDLMGLLSAVYGIPREQRPHE